MSWSNRSESPRMNSSHDHIRPRGSNPNPDVDGYAQQLQGFGRNFTSLLDQNTMQSQPPMSIELSQRGTLRQQQQGQPKAHTRLDSLQSPTSLQPQLSTLSSHSLDTNMGTDLSSDDRMTAQWYQHNFSSINWLPDNWTPDFQLEGHENMTPLDQDQSMDFSGTSRFGLNSENLMMNNSISPRIARRRDTSRMVTQLVEAHDISSPSSQSTHSGRFYVDGDGARLPRVRKPPYRYSDSHTRAFLPENRDSYPEFTFPELSELQDAGMPSISGCSIPPSVYAEILQVYTLTCINSSHYPNFQGGSFPSLYFFNRFINLYGTNFRSILPFVHPSSFDPATTHWLLLLALATIGSQYAELDSSGHLVVAMQEFLRRAIQTVVRC